MSVYLIDFAAFKPPEELRVNVEECERHGKNWPQYRDNVRDFMLKVFVKSGISPTTTYLPACIHPKHTSEPKVDLNTAQEEAEMVMCGAVSELLARTGIKPRQIDILVTCTSIYCATPSLASMLVNRFKMRSDIQSYHLGGMGCGTGVVAINLIRDLLKARPNSIAMFVPAEITSYCSYFGDEPNRMVANVIFRMGGAASLFSNRPSQRSVAKYELLHSVRTHHGEDDDAYRCMSWGPDAKGINGVYLGKNVIKCAGRVLEDVLTKSVWAMINPTIVVRYTTNWVSRNLLGYTDLPPYKPNLEDVFDHFCIHAGGYAVLKSIQDKTNMSSAKMIPSFAVLREYGNTSCSTTWYSMGYLETCEGVKKGQTVLQVGVGGGMKAGCNIWRALRNIRTRDHRAWQHLADSPITEADLPRGIDLGDIRDAKSKRLAEELSTSHASASAAAAAAPHPPAPSPYAPVNAAPAPAAGNGTHHGSGAVFEDPHEEYEDTPPAGSSLGVPLTPLLKHKHSNGVSQAQVPELRGLGVHTSEEQGPGSPESGSVTDLGA